MWVYIKSETNLWTVGFYKPNGEWNTDSDHDMQEDAARRVNFLNGGDYEAYRACESILHDAEQCDIHIGLARANMLRRALGKETK